MELPSLRKFKDLLDGDGIFCDYLNAFLSLPVFAKRILYNDEKKLFDVEPQLHFAYHVLHQPNLLSWIHESRLPLFWWSEFFYEYQLCRLLLQNNEVIPDGKSHWFESVSAMQQFRQFLFQTEGESMWMFWVDVEKLKSTKDSFIAHKLITRIQQLYLQEGAPFSLSQDDGHERKRRPSLSQRIDILVCGQTLALQELKSYWCNRYVLHLESTESSIENDQQGSKFRTMMCINENDKKIRTQKDSLYLPRIIEDEGNSGANERPRSLSCFQLNTGLPPLNDGTSLRSSAKHIPTKLSTQMTKLQLLITPSTEVLFPKSSQVETQEHNLLQAQKSTRLLPYLTASLRGDFMAGNPLLRYLRKVQCNRKATDNLLFWQSVENILTQDEMRRWYSKKFEANDCPYLNYFETYPIATNLKQLLHLFIKDNAPHKVDMPGEIRKELMVLLPKGLGQSLVLLVQEITTQHLLKPWQEYLCYDHLQFMKKCTTPKILTRLTSAITAEATIDSNPSPQIVTERLFSSSHLHCMWSALRFGEAAKYPGIYQLPSRRLTDVSLHQLSSKNMGTAISSQISCTADDDDDDDDEEDDVHFTSSNMATLTPMVTTLYNKVDWDWKNSKTNQNILYVTKPMHSSDFYSKKPKPPKSFIEVLKDREQLEYFRHYLLMHGVNVEGPLQFWMAIEDMKTTITSKRANNHKMRRLKERLPFLFGDSSRPLSGFDSAISELGAVERPSFFQLLAAQASTAAAIERKWFSGYVAYLTNKDQEENGGEEEAKASCTENSKGLWGMFAHNVISFRRGLMNSTTADMFKKFLKDEVIRGNRGHSQQKKLIGTKVINVTKLLNDLAFWAEVERYKDLADLVREGKEKGTHTQEDDILVHKKAHAIVNCFIDSVVYPKVQINISNELVGVILDNISQGLITRGLFHEAALNIFSVLILYWKKFCIARFAPNKRRHSTSMSTDSLISACASKSGRSGSKRHKMTHNLDSLREDHEGEAGEWHGYFGDGGPILSYSLSYGLRWTYYPGHPHLPALYHCGADNMPAAVFS